MFYEYCIISRRETLRVLCSTSLVLGYKTRHRDLLRIMKRGDESLINIFEKILRHYSQCRNALWVMKPVAEIYTIHLIEIQNRANKSDAE